MKLPFALSPLAASFLLLAGCTHEGASGGQTPSLLLKTETGVIEATPTAGGFSGPQLQLGRREGGGLAGFAFGRTVDLRWTENRVAGSLGGAPVDLILERGEGEVRMRGMLGGRLGNLAIRADGVQGSVGSCSYSLAGSWPGTLEGRRSCGTLPEVTYLRVPSSLTELPGPELAAVLAVMLGQ